MAQGLRASVNKRNKSKLRARVFGPVEDARTERLSAKLFELAQQSKPARNEMEVDGTEDKAQSTTASEEGKASAEGQSSKASRRSFSYPVPASLCCSDNGDSTSSDESVSEDEENKHCTEASSTAQHDGHEELFYTLLGLSTDITGFDGWGDLQMMFEH